MQVLVQEYVLTFERNPEPGIPDSGSLKDQHACELRETLLTFVSRFCLKISIRCTDVCDFMHNLEGIWLLPVGVACRHARHARHMMAIHSRSSARVNW